MKHQFDIIRDHLTLSECLFLARRHRAPAGCFFFSGAEASWRRRRREHATGFSVFSAASASVDIHLAARIGTDGCTPMCRPMAPPSRPAAAVRVRLRAAERGLERGGLERGRSSFAVGRASWSVYENKIDLLTGVINALSRVFHRPECGWIDSALSHTFSCPPVLSESALPGTCSLPCLELQGFSVVEGPRARTEGFGPPATHGRFGSPATQAQGSVNISGSAVGIHCNRT